MTRRRGAEISRPRRHVNYDVDPDVIYTYPEVASVRQIEEDHSRRPHPVLYASVPVHRQRPRQGQPPDRGFVKIRADAKPTASRRALVGPDAGNMSAERPSRWNSRIVRGQSRAPATPPDTERGHQ